MPDIGEMKKIPPARGRRFDPDWSIAIALIAFGWFAIWIVGAYFFWTWAS